MLDQINRVIKNRLLQVITVFLITSQLSYGDTPMLIGGLSGPTSVAPNSQATYVYDSGLFVWPRSWVITGGTLISSSTITNEEGDPAYQAVVQWGAAGAGTVKFKKSFQTLGTLNVTIATPPPSNYAFSNENYAHTVTPRVASTNVATLTASQKIEGVTYYDGLGRAVQNVGIHAGGNEEDLVTHIEYDLVGRQEKEFLSYADGLLANEATYRTGAANATTTFYAQKYAGTSNPYSEKHFEDSPLNRVEEQGAPGAAGSVNKSSDNDHTIKFKYATNKHNNVANQKVRLFTVSLTSNYTPTLNSTSYYADYVLNKTVTMDENWKSTDGYNKTTEEYTDKLGRVILKRTYNASVPHDTYYVYDKYGNLTYVLPPKSEPTSAKPDATELNELCYQYKYDKRNRLIEKKIPSKGWEYIVYDKLDRPVMTQDANQRVPSTDQWLVTKYDAFGRVAYTGVKNHNNSRSSFQSTISADPDQYENRKNSSSDYLDTYYSSVSSPSSINEVYTVSYYDDYAFNLNGGTDPGTVYGISTLDSPKGLSTGTKVKVLGTSNNWITTVSYYDDKARLIYIYSKNDYLNTTDIIEHRLDDFSGRLLETKTTHKKTGKANVVTLDKFYYDHADRVTKQTQKINLQAEELIAENTYDDLGRLEAKGVGHYASSGTRLQTIDYAYNIRSWLTAINNVYNIGDDLFSFRINYENPTSGTALYNGNISQTIWKTKNADQSVKDYRYGYDALNRIVTAYDDTGNYNLYNVSYDKNGNLLRLDRSGHTNIAATNFAYNMDQLFYTYETKSNKLKKVLDNGVDGYGFKDGTNVTTEYTYDANGNMKKDLNKNITNIAYNHLNLPTTVTINGQNISYIYDAIGAKLRKTVSGTTTDYAGNYVYENGNLQFLNTSEGYATPVNTANYNSGFNYIYQYKDHLGNIRMSYSDNISKNGSIAQNEIIEENNYYPFGLKHKGYNTGVGTGGNSVAQRYKFGGKELQDEIVGGGSLEWYDITARNYDPALGRWMNLDPLAEKMRRHSPYNYAFDNPVYFIDPDGMMPKGCCGNPLGTGPTALAAGRYIKGKAKQLFNWIKGGGSGTKSTIASGTNLTSDNPSASNPLNAETNVVTNPEANTAMNGDVLLDFNSMVGLKPTSNRTRPTANKKFVINAGKKVTEVTASGMSVGDKAGDVVNHVIKNNNDGGSMSNTNTTGEVSIDNEVSFTVEAVTFVKPKSREFGVSQPAFVGTEKLKLKSLVKDSASIKEFHRKKLDSTINANQ